MPAWPEIQQGPLWVTSSDSRVLPPPRPLSGCEADANDAKADMPAAMSAVEGRADVACQELSGPLIAITGNGSFLL
jgi:hypothetical protein